MRWDTVAESIVRGRLLRWGNSVGVRISMRDARRLNLQVGADVTVRISSEPGKVDLSALPTFRGGGDAGEEHDRILGEGRKKELLR
jgi:hypothetical protein